MTNNLRTLLLNLPASPMLAGHPFAQFIDPAFVPEKLGPAHTAFRNLVMGKSSDRPYMEFVATQLYRMAWSNPECRKVMDAVDTRSTIDPAAGHLRWSAQDVTATTIAGDGVSHAVTNLITPPIGKTSVDDMIIYTSLYSELDVQRYYESGEIPSASGNAGPTPVVMGYSKWTGGAGELPVSISGSLTVTPSSWFGLTFAELIGGTFQEFMVRVTSQSLPQFDLTSIINQCDWAIARSMASLPTSHHFYREGNDLLSIMSSSEAISVRFSAAVCAYQLLLS